VSAPLLAVRDLTVHFPVRDQRGPERGRAVRALDGVSFALQPGGALGIVGESGSGKSTLALALAGLVSPTSGSIQVDGVDAASRDRRARAERGRRLQLVFQDAGLSLDPRMSIGAIVAEPMDVLRAGAPRARRARALALLDAVGLDPFVWHARPHELSGGQRQRVAIARALALEPKVVVFDEPTAALDVSIRAQIVNLVARLRERLGLALIWISHDLPVVRHLCAEVLVLYLGRVVERGPTGAVFDAPAHPYTRALLDAVPRVVPGVERTRARIVLAGEPPSPLDPPGGCPFHPRCPDRARVPGERCAIERPELRAAGGRELACHIDPGA
jgi:oligopeptide/dipeptide ABC transporter ATP-binding protein